MANNNFKTVPIKGKGKGNIEVCNYNNKIIINPKDKASDISKKVSDCNSSKPKEIIVTSGLDTLQAPDNDWMVIEDTNYYKVPDSQKGSVAKQVGKGLSRISRVRANVVFVRYQGTLRKMLKMDKNAPYNYIDASTALPYYQYILKNKAQFQIDPKGYETIAWAEGMDKKFNNSKLSFDGTDSSFTGNTNLDLGIDGNTDLDLGIDGNTDLDLSFDGNTALDLSFDGNTNLDLGVDGEESGADGEYFYIVKPKTKIFAKDKKTGVVHNTKKKLGKGSKVKGTITKGVHKFRVKSKKSGTISTINKAAGFVIIGQNDLAQMLVPVGAIRPINISNFDGNTNLDLGFDGNTNLDLGVDGIANTLEREMKVNLNHRIGIDGNTDLDLSFDGRAMRKHFRTRPQLDNVPNGLDLGIDGEDNFNGRVRRLVGDNRIMNVRVPVRGRRPALDVSQNMDLGVDVDSEFQGGALEQDFNGGGDMLYFDGSENMSNAVGDWFKKMKQKRAIKKIEKTEKKSLSKEEAAVLSNDNKVVFTEEEMKAVYKSSGSTKPFSEWTKGEGAKNFFNSITQFGAAFLENKSKQASGEPIEEGATLGNNDTTRPNDTGGQKLILGMHPLTFGIVAVSVGLVAIGAIVYFGKKGKTVPVVAGV